MQLLSAGMGGCLLLTPEQVAKAWSRGKVKLSCCVQRNAVNRCTWVVCIRVLQATGSGSSSSSNGTAAKTRTQHAMKALIKCLVVSAR
jgi:hypothetical protein